MVKFRILQSLHDPQRRLLADNLTRSFMSSAGFYTLLRKPGLMKLSTGLRVSGQPVPSGGHVDALSRISPAVDVRRSYRGTDVVETLERVVARYRLRRHIRLDNGPEFISRDLDLWCYARGVVLVFARSSKPTDNAFAESFNGKVRAKCLNANWFLSLDNDPPPLKWPALRYGFEPEEDRDGEQEAPA